MKELNDFQKGLVNKHAYHGFTSHFSGIYRGAQLFCFLLLCVSAVFSTAFFESYFSMLGEYAPYAGAFVSICIAVGIGALTSSVLSYWSAQQSVEPMLGTLLALLLVGNVLADFNGAQDLGESLVGVAPTDTKTSEIAGIYEPQISAIDAEVDAIEAKNFYWCGTHKKAHKCPDAGFHIHPTQDRKAVAQIEALKAQKAELVSTMNGLLQSNGEAHSSALSTHAEKVEKARGRMRFGSLACTALFLLLSMWSHKYGVRAVSELKTHPTASTLGKGGTTISEGVTPRQPSKRKNKRKKGEAKGHNHAKSVKRPSREPSPEELAEVEDFFEAELDEHDELAEEYRAMQEKEARGKQ